MKSLFINNTWQNASGEEFVSKSPNGGGGSPEILQQRIIAIRQLQQQRQHNKDGMNLVLMPALNILENL